MNDIKEFLKQREQNTKQLGNLEKDKNVGKDFLIQSSKYNYSYNFDWLGLPIIQFPQDIVAMQEIIWTTKPDVIVETGVARGGSLLLSASLLHLLNGDGIVIGVDIDIRPHNREAIEEHPLAARIKLIQGSSVAEETLQQVKNCIADKKRVMVILDSNHTHEHVLKELALYSPLVSSGCYLVVMDTIVEDMPDDFYSDRPWSKGNNPKTAVHEFLKNTTRFEIDKNIQNKLMITVAPDGYLRCVK